MVELYLERLFPEQGSKRVAKKNLYFIYGSISIEK
jgi:hypothetical protein